MQLPDVPPGRAPLPFAEALDAARRRTGLDLAGARARVGFARSHLLEAVIHAPGVGSADDERALDGAETFLEALLGTRTFDDWIGAVDVAPLPRGGPLAVVGGGSATTAPLAIDEIAGAVTAAVTGLSATLPEAPCHAWVPDAEWTLLEVDDPAAAIGPDDPLFLSTALPEMARCHLVGDPFASLRFSRHGERFVRVVAKTGALRGEAQHARRLELEDALDDALVPAGLGVVVAAGLALDGAVFLVAATRLDESLAALLGRLRTLAAPPGSGVTFCDTIWESERVVV